jgi:biotin transport system substrate-specific component
MTLSTALFGSQTLLKQALMVIGGSLLVASAAQVSVPMYPVPVTLQTLAVLLVGFAFGSRLGAITLAAYLAEGAIGLPVFANFNNGAAFAGPTAGFLVGFVGMAWLAGLATDLGYRKLLPLAAFAIEASIFLYIPGVLWAMFADALFGFDATRWGADNFNMIWTYYIAPFLVGDAVKAILAALMVTGAWAALGRRKA